MRISSTTVWRAGLAVVLIALAMPLLALIAISVNESQYGTLPFHFSTRWYRALGEDSSLIAALRTSLLLAVQVTIVCVVVGTGLAIGLVRSGRAIRGATNSLLLVLLTVPALVLAAGMLEVLGAVGMGQSSLSLLLACTVMSLPFVVLVVTAKLQALDPSLAEAARTLGASPWRVFVRITLPLIAPSLLAGGLLAFVICFNNFAIQLFIAPLGVSLLPVQIYSMERLGITPDVSALGAILIVSAALVILALNLLTGSAARLLTTSGKEKS